MVLLARLLDLQIIRQLINPVFRTTVLGLYKRISNLNVESTYRLDKITTLFSILKSKIQKQMSPID